MNGIYLIKCREYHNVSSKNLVKPAGQHCADWGYNKHRYITIRGIVSVRRVNFGNA